MPYLLALASSSCVCAGLPGPMRGRLASRSFELSESEPERVAESNTLNQHPGTSHTVTFTFRDVVEVFGVRLMFSRGGGHHGCQRHDVYIIRLLMQQTDNYKTTGKGPTPTGPENKKEIVRLDLPFVQ